MKKINTSLGYAMHVARISLSQLVTLSVLMIIFNSCEKLQDDPIIPDVITVAIKDVTANSAMCEAMVTSTGKQESGSRGFLWSEVNQEPSVDDQLCFCWYGTGNFSGYLANLSPRTTYYVRAYAYYDCKCYYGNVMKFETKDLDDLSAQQTINY